jgi:hypothetical protein
MRALLAASLIILAGCNVGDNLSKRTPVPEPMRYGAAAIDAEMRAHEDRICVVCVAGQLASCAAPMRLKCGEARAAGLVPRYEYMEEP